MMTENTNKVNNKTTKKTTSKSKAMPKSRTLKTQALKDLPKDEQKQMMDLLKKNGIDPKTVTDIHATKATPEELASGDKVHITFCTISNFISAVKDRLVHIIFERNMDLSIVPKINAVLEETLFKSTGALENLAKASVEFSHYGDASGVMIDFDYDTIKVDADRVQYLTPRQKHMYNLVDHMAEALLINALTVYVDENINLDAKTILKHKKEVADVGKISMSKVALFKLVNDIVKKTVEKDIVYFGITSKNKKEKDIVKSITESCINYILGDIDNDINFKLLDKFIKNPKDEEIVKYAELSTHQALQSLIIQVTF